MVCSRQTRLHVLENGAVMHPDQRELTCVEDTPFSAAFNRLSLFLNRLFGIKSVIQTDCSSTWKIIVNPELSWYHHANPILLLVMYYTLATLIRIWLQEPLVRTKGFLFLSA